MIFFRLLMLAESKSKKLDSEARSLECRGDKL